LKGACDMGKEVFKRRLVHCVAEASAALNNFVLLLTSLAPKFEWISVTTYVFLNDKSLFMCLC